MTHDLIAQGPSVETLKLIEDLGRYTREKGLFLADELLTGLLADLYQRKTTGVRCPEAVRGSDLLASAPSGWLAPMGAIDARESPPA